MKNLIQTFLVYIDYLLLCALGALGVTFGPQAPFNRAMRRQMGAVVNVDSTCIANTKLTPNVINKAFLCRGRVHQSRGIVSVTNGDSIASIYRVLRVRSNDLVHRLEILNSSCGAACTGDVGLYRTSQDGGAVVDVDYFATAVDLNTARLAPLDITREAAAGPATVANMEKRIWEALGLSADPGIEYDVAVTLTAAAAATGAVCLQCEVVPAAG